MGTVTLTDTQIYWYRRRKSRNPRKLTSIWGLGAKHAAALISIGIPDCKTLMGCDPDAVAASLRAESVPTSANQVYQWRYHAESYITKQPIFFGPPPAVGDLYLVLDLEYDPVKPHIWLIGLLICDGEQRQHIGLWADDPDQERDNLLHLAGVLRNYPHLPVLTWAGASADIPQLALAAGRHGIDNFMAELECRHMDLFAHARNSVRLPMPELSLGPFANYLRIPKTSPIRNGLEAQMQYEIYRGLRDPDRKAMRKSELVAYNYDDLAALVGVLAAMRDTPRTLPPTV
jgi:predicted RecB family nuclease